MKTKLTTLILLTCSFLLMCGCRNEEQEMASLLEAMETYETAWAAGDFLTVESFFAPDAKRLHTEPHVWDRAEIKQYFEERARQTPVDSNVPVNTDWKRERDYLEIRVEGKIGYDIFTTERFKALHIWEKQKDGSWKIKYDMGMLNYPEKK